MDIIDKIANRMLTEGDSDAAYDEVEALVVQIYPLFIGKDSTIIGFAIADLLATWLAGHVITDNRTDEVDTKATKKIREKMLEITVTAALRLVPHNFKEYVEPKLKDKLRERAKQ